MSDVDFEKSGFSRKRDAFRYSETQPRSAVYRNGKYVAIRRRHKNSASVISKRHLMEYAEDLKESEVVYEGEGEECKRK